MNDDPRLPDLRWLTSLRWVLVLLEATLVASWASARSVPWPWLAMAMAAQLVSNAALVRAGSTWREGIAFGLVIDVASIATILACGGGAASPFCVVLLVQVTVAAVLLRAARLAAVVALSIAAYASLFAFTDPLHGLGAHLHEMFAAFSLTAMVIAVAVGRLAVELERARARADASSRVMGMTTLAAGAAHELSTPLATIKTIVGELERELAGRDDLAHVREDLSLVRTEIARSRAILDQLSVAAGELRGEAPTSIALRSLERSIDALPDDARARVRWSWPDGSSARIPERAIGQALSALVKNALDASPASSLVEVRGTIERERLAISVRDQGTGMSAETLARVGEPFFTTKDPGRGMGLGVFLVRALAAHLGGEVTIDSARGRGTTVTLDLPLVPEPIRPEPIR